MSKFNIKDIQNNFIEILKQSIKEKEINLNLGQNINLDKVIQYFKNFNPTFNYKDCLVISNLSSFEMELLIDYFVDDIKIKARKKNNISLYDLFYNNDDCLELILTELYNSIDFDKKMIGNKKIEYIDGLFIRNYIYNNAFCKIYCKEISHFSISVSISVYKYYKSLKVSDPCIGWG